MVAVWNALMFAGALACESVYGYTRKWASVWVRTKHVEHALSVYGYGTHLHLRAHMSKCFISTGTCNRCEKKIVFASRVVTTLVGAGR